MRQITQTTIKELQGKAPGASSTDRADLQIKLSSGGIFENFSVLQREEFWQRVCSASQQCLIPSLFTFFEDRKFLDDAAGCIRKVLDVNEKGTIISSLEEIFSDINQEEGKCVIQLSETDFGTIAGDSNRRLDLGIRQLWLAAFRNYLELPTGTQKSDVLALSRTKSDETTLYELAHLALRLGFESDKLCEIIQTCPDRKIAEYALLSARKPGRFKFHDLESCIQQIIAAFNTADRETTAEAMEVMREIDKPPNRHGRPHGIDYQYDKTQLFLPLMPEYLNTDMGEITSTFIRWSVYCAYFGPPPIIGNISPSGSLVRNSVVVVEDECIDYEYIEFPREDSSMEVSRDEGSEIFVTASHELQPEPTKFSDSELRANEVQCDMIVKKRIFDEMIQDIEEKIKERSNLQEQLNIEQQRLNEVELKKQEVNLLMMKIQDDSAREQLSLDEIAQDIEKKTKERDKLQQELENEQESLNSLKQERQEITSFMVQLQQNSAMEQNVEDIPREAEEMNKHYKMLRKPLGGNRKSGKRMKLKKVDLKRLRLPQSRKEKLQEVDREIESKGAELASIQQALATAKRDLPQDITAEYMQHANQIAAERKAELERAQGEISTIQELLKKANYELQQINIKIQKKSAEFEQVKNNYTIQEENLRRTNNELREKISELEQNKDNCNKQEEILREINESIQNKQEELIKIEDDCNKKKEIVREIDNNIQKKQLGFGEVEAYLGAEQELLRIADKADQWKYIVDNNMHSLEDQISFEEQEHLQKRFQTYGKILRKRAQLGPENEKQGAKDEKQEKSSQISSDFEMEVIQLSDSAYKNNTTPPGMSEECSRAFPEEQRLHEINQEILGKDIQLEKLQKSIASKQQSVHDLDRKLEELRQNIATQQENLDKVVEERKSNDKEPTALKIALDSERKAFEKFREANKTKQSEIDRKIADREKKFNQIIEQLQEKDLELINLKREVEEEQAKLKQLKIAVNQEQGISETSKPREAQTQLVPRESRRNLILLEYQLSGHNPNKKAIMDITEGDSAKNNEPSPNVCVDFVNFIPPSDFTRSKWVVSDTVVVDPSDPGEVTKIAKKYERKGFTLCKKDGTRITAENCFEEVKKDGSYVVLIGMPCLREESTEVTEVRPEIRKDKEKDRDEDEDGRKKKKRKNGN